MAAEENQALRSDLERTRDFIERESKDDRRNDDLTEQRIQDLQRKYEDAQEELMSMEHQREDERIHYSVLSKELEEWRQVDYLIKKTNKKLGSSYLNFRDPTQPFYTSLTHLF